MLKVQCDLQTHKVDLLEEQLDLMSSLNCGIYNQLANLEDYVHHLESPSCGHGSCQKAKQKHDPLHWHDFEKAIEDKKRGSISSRTAVAILLNLYSTTGLFSDC